MALPKLATATYELQLPSTAETVKYRPFLVKEQKVLMVEGCLSLFRAYRGLPKNKNLIKFLSEEGSKQLLQKTENFYMQDNNREMPKVDSELYFVIDEKNNQVYY